MCEYGVSTRPDFESVVSPASTGSWSNQGSIPKASCLSGGGSRATWPRAQSRPNQDSPHWCVTRGKWSLCHASCLRYSVRTIGRGSSRKTLAWTRPCNGAWRTRASGNGTVRAWPRSAPDSGRVSSHATPLYRSRPSAGNPLSDAGDGGRRRFRGSTASRNPRAQADIAAASERPSERASHSTGLIRRYAIPLSNTYSSSMDAPDILLTGETINLMSYEKV